MIDRLRHMGVVRRAEHLWNRAEATLPVRSWQRYADLRGNRLAGAVSFYGFISLFPLLLLTAAVTAFALPDSAEDDVKEQIQKLINDNIPGLDLDVGAFFDSAGTLSVIGAATLMFTGLSWVDNVRAAVRSMWRLDDQPGNIVSRKAVDLAALIGLGVLLLASWAASVGLSQLAGQVLDLLGIDGTWGTAMLQVIGVVLAVLVSSLLFAYLLSGLPRIRVPFVYLAWVSLLGGLCFELLRQVLVTFIVGAADRDAYATLGTPLAVLAWIYVVTRLLMFLAALMAESAEGLEGADDATDEADVSREQPRSDQADATAEA